MKYEVICNGENMGIYEGATPEEAVLAMHRSAGLGAGAVQVIGGYLVAGPAWDDAWGRVDDCIAYPAEEYKS